MSAFDGTIHRPGEPGYEEARQTAVWNALKPDRRPAAIVVAASRDDVARAVALARDEGLSIGVRSGGHAWNGNGVREAGLLLDLSHLRAIEIDAESGVATVEPGVRSRELTTALAEHGLYFPGGHCPTVGVTGFTLGGGFGFNSRVVGPAAFSLRAIDVVTASGETPRATDDDHADILWAARGTGPGFFAAVTRMHLDVRPAPGVLAASIQIHPLAAYDELLPWYAEVSGSIAPEVNPVLIAAHSPVPGQDATILMVTAYAFADDMGHAAELLAPLETAPGVDRAIMHQSAHPSSFDAQYAILDQIYPDGFRYLTDNAWVRPLDEGLWPDAKWLIETLPSARSHIVLAPWVPQTQPNAAFGLQSEMSFHVYAVYEDEADDASMLEWHAEAMRRIDPYTNGGGKVNDSNLFERPMAVLRPDAAARLEELRGTYDPDGVFDAYPCDMPPARTT